MNLPPNLWLHCNLTHQPSFWCATSFYNRIFQLLHFIYSGVLNWYLVSKWIFLSAYVSTIVLWPYLIYQFRPFFPICRPIITKGKGYFITRSHVYDHPRWYDPKVSKKRTKLSKARSVGNIIASFFVFISYYLWDKDQMDNFKVT